MDAGISEVRSKSIETYKLVNRFFLPILWIISSMYIVLLFLVHCFFQFYIGYRKKWYDRHGLSRQC